MGKEQSFPKSLCESCDMTSPWLHCIVTSSLFINNLITSRSWKVSSFLLFLHCTDWLTDRFIVVFAISPVRCGSRNFGGGGVRTFEIVSVKQALNANNKQTNFRWPEIYFELSFFFTYCQVFSLAILHWNLNFSAFLFFWGGGGSLGTTKSPQTGADFL